MIREKQQLPQSKQHQSGHFLAQFARNKKIISNIFSSANKVGSVNYESTRRRQLVVISLGVDFS